MNYKISNKYIELEFSSEVHNLVCLLNKTTGDNYIKQKPINNIFSLYVRNSKSDNKVKTFPNDNYNVVIEGNKEYEKLRCVYNTLMMKDKEIKVVVTIDILI